MYSVYWKSGNEYIYTYTYVCYKYTFKPRYFIVQKYFNPELYRGFIVELTMGHRNTVGSVGREGIDFRGSAVVVVVLSAVVTVMLVCTDVDGSVSIVDAAVSSCPCCCVSPVCSCTSPSAAALTVVAVVVAVSTSIPALSSFTALVSLSCTLHSLSLFCSFSYKSCRKRSFSYTLRFNNGPFSTPWTRRQ